MLLGKDFSKPGTSSPALPGRGGAGQGIEFGTSEFSVIDSIIDIYKAGFWVAQAPLPSLHPLPKTIIDFQKITT